MKLFISSSVECRILSLSSCRVFINLQTLILERNKETENGTETEIDLLIGNTTVLHTEHQISNATTHGKHMAVKVLKENVMRNINTFCLINMYLSPECPVFAECWLV